MVRRIQVAVIALSVMFLAVVVPRGAQAGSPRDVPSSSLVTLGGAYTVEAGGCERHARSFRVSSRRPIDVFRVERGQVVSGVFLRPRDRAGRAGWRNVSVSSDGLAVEFELYAEGTGRFQAVPAEGRQCVESNPARVVVDVEAWVVNP
jgi:hypothetical protein